MQEQSTPPRDDQPLVVLYNRTSQDLADGRFDVVVKYAKARGWRLLDIGLTGGSLYGEKPAGALTTYLPDTPYVRYLRDMGCPIVRLGSLEHPEDDVVPAVLPDLKATGRVAAKYLAARGFRHTGLFGHESMEGMALVDAGMRAEAQARDMTYHVHKLNNLGRKPRTYHLNLELADKRNAQIMSFIESLPKPVGIVAINSHQAGMVSVLTQKAGFLIPEQVAILSLNNEPYVCELLNITISGMETGQAHIMKVAVERLEQLMRGESIPARTHVLRPRIHTRRSTDILAVDHPLVARAIRYLWDRLDRDVCVEEVAEAMEVSRPKLEKLFREHFDRGIHAELRRARLEKFAELLCTTDLPVRKLAPKVGFKSPKFLHDSFVKEYDITPRQYRLKHSRNNVEDDV